ncbi:Rab GDP dissociation inhibitor alpha, variant 2 [Ancistrocladus abbreviatus]
MSSAVTSSKKMGFDENKRREEDDGATESAYSLTAKEEEVNKIEDEETGDRFGFGRQTSEVSLNATEEEEDCEGRDIDLGPQFTLKEQLEKDKDDESLRRWKEQLLGSVDFDNAGEVLEPEVKILSLAILSPGRPDILLSVPEDGKPRRSWFALKEGSRYKLRFTFQVSGNIVSGLKYRNTVRKTGLKVDSTKVMLGTFSPQIEPYVHEMPEETTPSGLFAKGSYSARSKLCEKLLSEWHPCHVVSHVYEFLIVTLINSLQP